MERELRLTKEEKKELRNLRNQAYFKVGLELRISKHRLALLFWTVLGQEP